ncbi:MAG: hypothetical protein V1838_00315 [Patescibacteria group bacterium]
MASPLLTLPDDQVIGYVRDHLAELLDEQPAPASYIRTRLLSLPEKKRGELAQKMKAALLSSNQSVSGQALQMIGGPILPPTAANYLNDLKDLSRSAWQARSQMWTKLDQADKYRIGRLFELYQLLQLPPDKIDQSIAPTEDIPPVRSPEATPSRIAEPFINAEKYPTDPLSPLLPVVKTVATSAGVNLTEANLQNRFSAIVISGIKGIRSGGQLAEVLTRAKDAGGSGLDEVTTQKVINAIYPLTKEFADGNIDLSSPKLKPPPIESPTPPVIPMASPLPPAPAVIPSPVINPVPPPPIPRRTVISKPTPVAPSQKIPVAATPSLAPSQRPAIRRPISRRPTVHDIKRPVSKLVGPLEELKSMDLTNFHRLGSTPAEIVEKIKEKIDLLGDESITRQADGVRAWKQSPINQLYIQMGHNSLAEGKSIDEIIKARETSNQPYLTDREFRAVVDLNKALRF